MGREKYDNLDILDMLLILLAEQEKPLDHPFTHDNLLSARNTASLGSHFIYM